jgi:glutathione synthase/RimK-type ligase-like ATP-grasp enzyme
LLLILTNKLDAHADHLIRKVAGAFPILRINTDDFLEDYAFALGLDGQGRISGSISDAHGHAFCFSERAIGWYRKPDFSEMRVRADPASASLVRTESAAFVDALTALSGIHWVNRPAAAFGARSKPAQLMLASELGFKVPATLITNAADKALEFAEAVGGNVVVKSVYSATVAFDGNEFACITKRIDSDMLRQSADAISLCPTQFQQEIVKECDLRVTVVGDQIFACRIESQGHATTEVDWRVDPDLCRYSTYELPDWAENACRRIVAQAGLEYGAIDLVLSAEGDLVFLENNPGGQYLWIEIDTGMPITDALITLFARHMQA